MHIVRAQPVTNVLNLTFICQRYMNIAYDFATLHYIAMAWCITDTLYYIHHVTQAQCTAKHIIDVLRSKGPLYHTT